MASRSGFPLPGGLPSRSSIPASPGAPTGSVGNAHMNNILKDFQHEQVVYALMDQLREKETQLAAITEQQKHLLRQHQITQESNKQLQGVVDLHNKALAEKDTRIAVLEKQLYEKQLNLERVGNGSAIAEASMRSLAETSTERRRIIEERDDELSNLRPMVANMKAKLDEYESKHDLRAVEELEEELANMKEELTLAENEVLASNNSIEELEKKIKGKEWMIKSLQEESLDQRSRENHLLAHIETLEEKIETYEAKFKGKGIDVPILLAKLKDYEVRVKDLRGQVRRLTNKKLNELVVRSSPLPFDKDPKAPKAKSRSKPQQDEQEDDNDSKASDGSCSFVESEDEATFASHGTDIDDILYQESAQEEDVLDDFLSDVTAGFETMKFDMICCVQGSSEPMKSPLAEIQRNDSPRSPGSFS
eukprot:CAMPEP_0183736572 /NCGR_PEP_ID=MMETSP0737-20130205/49613_1 /TAXON_ID=385413 /ORGANISM="Thalassiosira miniscula, Strain CCMP1093" /LENGTH=419 /DNA_ID=CAMNT_0025970611 /DNA_START=9 /DNA_END=1268 /DNA_ORIENTATION=+